MTTYQDYGYPNDNPCHAFDYMLAPLLSLLHKTNNSCILDLGCGNGYFVNYLISQGFNAYGIDASEQGITIANKTNPGRFFIQDLSSGGLPQQISHLPFDTIVSTEVIEHLYDPYLFISLCRDILSKTNGELILSTPYHGYLKNLFISLFNKWDTHISPLWQGGHIKFWSFKTLSAILQEHDFKVTDFKGSGRIPYFWKSMIVKANLR
ncbi:class I SAM-dependent methyltransferase [Mucilaginibacter sp. HC2]|uniref:class I SAM-dependent methyltransferase n=1 Tax=Mucilaginibacter inviolabilis TaxID=2714892 RepID=UPI00140BCAFE|nr:class I SAM-dependent methyltransferase [Mucilaginibacter inviolabilis]NHA04958.1 class I SAM-dependent methyltransferase [Mucilaginibacter inviolabilis]